MFGFHPTSLKMSKKDICTNVFEAVFYCLKMSKKDICTNVFEAVFYCLIFISLVHIVYKLIDELLQKIPTLFILNKGNDFYPMRCRCCACPPPDVWFSPPALPWWSRTTAPSHSEIQTGLISSRWTTLNKLNKSRSEPGNAPRIGIGHREVVCQK